MPPSCERSEAIRGATRKQEQILRRSLSRLRGRVGVGVSPQDAPFEQIGFPPPGALRAPTSPASGRGNLACIDSNFKNGQFQIQLRIPAARYARVAHKPFAQRGRGAAPSGERGMPGARCTRSRACRIVSARVSHHGRTGIARHSRTRWFTAYFALSLVTGLSCHHRLADTSATLDASVGASGPHDFAVRKNSALVSSATRVHRIPTLRP